MQRTRRFVLLSPGDRPSATSQHSPPWTVARPTPAVLVPAFLIVLLVLASLRSWLVLRPRLVDLTRWSGRSLDSSSNIDNHPVSNQNHPSGMLGATRISPIFSPQVQHWSDDITRWAVEHELDSDLLAVVMQIESCGHPSIHSSAGALGLFQVMPFHFTEDEDPLDPYTNANRGLVYLARSLEISNGRIDLALAGYNGGHSVIQWDPSLWPDETTRYVYWGAGILEDVNAGLAHSPRLTEWLSNGGNQFVQSSFRGVGPLEKGIFTTYPSLQAPSAWGNKTENVVPSPSCESTSILPLWLRVIQ